MRTTVTLDDDAAALVRRRMAEQGVSFKRAVNDAIRAGASATSGPPFRTATADMGEPTVALEKALNLAGDLEDEELIRRSRIGT